MEGVAHLSEVSLQLRPGEFNILLGETLAGKTTLLRMMGGLDRPDQGKILFFGDDVTRTPVQKRGVAMVYQEFINYPSLTVYDNIASPLVAARVPRDEVELRVHRTAELLHLSPFLQRRPAEMSGGQQQRLALARALVKEARLVLLDEPLANLDYKLREELRDELPRLLADQDAVIVYATSDPGEALLLGGKTAVMHQGRVTQFDDTVTVYQQPRDLDTACIFADPPLNQMRAVKDAAGVRLDGEEGKVLSRVSSLAALPDGPCTLAFRAHHLLLEQPAAAAIKMTGEVLLAEITGSDSYLHLRVASHEWVAHTSRIDKWEVGSSVDLFIDHNCLLAFAPDGRNMH